MAVAGGYKRLLRSSSAGFSLIELMIVVVILGILAAAVGINLKTGDTSMKRFTFNLKLQMRQAKAEAIKRSRKVYVDFDFDADGNIDNGYTVWADDNRNGVYDNGVDTKIKEVVFENKVAAPTNKDGPEIYESLSGTITGGPGNDGIGTGTIGDGVTVATDAFAFRPDGTVDNAGTVYIYLPQTNGAAKGVASGPWAVIVDSVGRIRLDEYKNGKWWMWKTGTPVEDN